MAANHTPGTATGTHATGSDSSNAGTGTPTPGLDEVLEGILGDQRLANLVNRAVSSQLKREIGKAVPDAVRSSLIDPETISAFKEALGTGTPAAGTGKPSKGKDSEGQRTPEDDETKQRLARVEQELKAERDQRKVIEKNARDDRLRGELVARLTDPAGTFKLSKERATRLARDMMRENEVAYDESTGDPRWKIGADTFDLDEGAKRWAKTAEGKEYVPPVPGSGSGAKPSATPAPNDGNAQDVSKLSVKEQDAMLAKTLFVG